MTYVQLDFLGNYLNNYEKQPELFTETLGAQKPLRFPKYREVEEFFSKLSGATVGSYQEYWDRIAPKTTSQTFQRWLFAFMSVHTSWKANVDGYNAIKSWWQWLGNEEKLLNKITESRVGMQNNRTRYISNFAQDFWQSPDVYEKASDEDWTTYRDRLEGRILGLGPAKTSFSLEMCFPNEAYITCLDTHLFQVYGLNQARDLRMYGELEAHWLDMSRMWNVPPYIARCIYWDQKQKKEDSRYWSYVFE
jgi:thermostable 8-oxoguanine DNA glycosylase